jgi:hypothetical protein
MKCVKCGNEISVQEGFFCDETAKPPRYFHLNCTQYFK